MSYSIVFFDVDPKDQPRVLQHFPEVVFHPATLTPQEIVEACKDAEVISTFITTPFPKAVLEQLPKLKLLCTRSVGYDHIDLTYCTERGIVVCNVPDYGSHVIAEHVFALLLSTLRHIVIGTQRVREGVFDYHGLRGMALRDKTLGIIGTGKIGCKVAEIAHGFGMRILAQDIYVRPELVEKYGVQYVERPELYEKSDIITLHAPALPATKHMINAETIAQMKDGVIIVNTARGSLIDSKALLSALEAGKVTYALLDVLEHESSVEHDKALVHHPHVVTTPHIAFYADDSIRTMYTDSIESIQQWKRGEKPTHVVG
jgi:D-lactate dehydrogenase